MEYKSVEPSLFFSVNQITSLTNILSPEMIIIAGGIANAGKELFVSLKKYMSIFEWRAGGNKTEIVKAHYGELSGAIGAACFARENY
jgi:glucokinase